MTKTVADLVIEWNLKQIKRAKDPKDVERYEENIRALREFKAKDEDAPSQ
jgi:hypothetical protein